MRAVRSELWRIDNPVLPRDYARDARYYAARHYAARHAARTEERDTAGNRGGSGASSDEASDSFSCDDDSDDGDYDPTKKANGGGFLGDIFNMAV